MQLIVGKACGCVRACVLGAGSFQGSKVKYEPSSSQVNSLQYLKAAADVT